MSILDKKDIVANMLERLNGLAGSTLKVWTIQSSHSSITFLVSGGSLASDVHLTFSNPTYIDVSFVMTNVRFKVGEAAPLPESVENYAALLDNFYGCHRSEWVSKIVTIIADEGTFILFADKAQIITKNVPNLIAFANAKSAM